MHSHRFGGECQLAATSQPLDPLVCRVGESVALAWVTEAITLDVEGRRGVIDHRPERDMWVRGGRYWSRLEATDLRWSRICISVAPPWWFGL